MGQSESSTRSRPSSAPFGVPHTDQRVALVAIHMWHPKAPATPRQQSELLVLSRCLLDTMRTATTDYGVSFFAHERVNEGLRVIGRCPTPCHSEHTHAVIEMVKSVSSTRDVHCLVLNTADDVTLRLYEVAVPTGRGDGPTFAVKHFTANGTMYDNLHRVLNKAVAAFGATDHVQRRAWRRAADQLCQTGRLTLTCNRLSAAMLIASPAATPPPPPPTAVSSCFGGPPCGGRGGCSFRANRKSSSPMGGRCASPSDVTVVVPPTSSPLGVPAIAATTTTTATPKRSAACDVIRGTPAGLVGIYIASPVKGMPPFGAVSLHDAKDDDDEEEGICSFDGTTTLPPPMSGATTPTSTMSQSPSQHVAPSNLTVAANDPGSAHSSQAQPLTHWSRVLIARGTTPPWVSPCSQPTTPSKCPPPQPTHQAAASGSSCPTNGSTPTTPKLCSVDQRLSQVVVLHFAAAASEALPTQNVDEKARHRQYLNVVSATVRCVVAASTRRINAPRVLRVGEGHVAVFWVCRSDVVHGALEHAVELYREVVASVDELGLPSPSAKSKKGAVRPAPAVDLGGGRIPLVAGGVDHGTCVIVSDGAETVVVGEAVDHARDLAQLGATLRVEAGGPTVPCYFDAANSLEVLEHVTQSQAVALIPQRMADPSPLTRRATSSASFPLEAVDSKQNATTLTMCNPVHRVQAPWPVIGADEEPRSLAAVGDEWHDVIHVRHERNPYAIINAAFAAAVDGDVAGATRCLASSLERRRKAGAAASAVSVEAEAFLSEALSTRGV